MKAKCSFATCTSPDASGRAGCFEEPGKNGKWWWARLPRRNPPPSTLLLAFSLHLFNDVEQDSSSSLGEISGVVHILSPLWGLADADGTILPS